MTNSSRPDAEQLLPLVRDGDDTARGLLLEMYRNFLTLLARYQIGRRLQGKVDAADVVQDTFLEAHRDFAQFRGTTEAQLTAWLRQILARNLANLIGHDWGTQRRDIRLERALADELEQSSHALDRALVAKQSTPSGRAVRREQGVSLANALDKLPVGYREVIVLHYVEGMSFPEIARRLGCSLDSVKKRWVRGLARLRQTMGDAP